jgi:hypothetical protein
MANKTEATPQKEEAREKGLETPDAPLPLPDLSGGAVKQFIKQAKNRGYVTYEQLNAVVPSEEVIRDVKAFVSKVMVFDKPACRTPQLRAPRSKPICK